MLDLRTASVSFSRVVALSGLATLAGCGGGVTLACPEGYAPVADGRCIPLAADAGAIPLADAAPMIADADTTTDAGTMADAAMEAPDGCGGTIWFRDVDGDGAGDSATTMLGCTAPSGWVAMAGDCDDTHAEAHPGGTEVCDGLDNDCDGGVDVGLTHTFYADADGDGFGNPAMTTTACTESMGYVSDASDCDDSCPACHPHSTETCDGHDNDCNGMTDEAGGGLWFVDCDGDGYAWSLARSVTSCAAPAAPTADCGAAAAATWTQRAPTGARSIDCGDGDAHAFPGSAFVGTTAFRSGAGGTSFDFDCNGTVEHRVSTVATAPATCVMRVLGGSSECVASSESWESSVPTCGVVGRLHTCSTTCTAATLNMPAACH